MSSNLVRIKRTFVAISLIAIIALLASCGTESIEPAASDDGATNETKQPSASTTLMPPSDRDKPMEYIDDEPPRATAVPAEQDKTSSNTKEVSDTPIPATLTPDAEASEQSTQIAAPDPTEPPLINTPAPVSNLAPDFTLPSVQGDEYTLSSFRGDKPVAVVFYRAYW
ncbi:MAG: redoxin domain-containing protein [Chloroflexi bacterium]|jgi:hypothetical protein|nr:redoxin domain-containing protein [Chloroflexota bacterium]MBT5627113.1 redoxin domain-containing protein [Chloroflexota bacterium]